MPSVGVPSRQGSICVFGMNRGIKFRVASVRFKHRSVRYFSINAESNYGAFHVHRELRRDVTPSAELAPDWLDAQFTSGGNELLQAASMQ